MAKYYFTYGSDDEKQAFKGGWTEVEAPNIDMAYAAFEIFHPANNDGSLSFCMCYTEEDFLASRMSSQGNLGKRCQERIQITRELIGGGEQ